MNRFFSALLLASSLAGCSSKWAIDDPVYAEKYDTPYRGNDADKVARMIKQSLDARYVADRGGSYAGAGGSSSPPAAGIELGRFAYVDSSIEGRIGLKGLVGTGANGWFGGLDTGIRVQAPSRLAPFVGAGAYLGGTKEEVLAENDRIDNDNDGSIDELEEMDDNYRFLASIYPEAGVHWWMTENVRLTGSAQYHLNTDGRDTDFWFVGFHISVLDAAKEYTDYDGPVPSSQ